MGTVFQRLNGIGENLWQESRAFLQNLNLQASEQKFKGSFTFVSKYQSKE